MKKIVLLVALGVLAVPHVPTAQTPQPGGVIIERVLVRVNGEILTQSQLTERQIDALRDLKAQVDPKTLQDDATLGVKLAEITPDILVNAVDELLLVQHGRELGLKFSDADFARTLDNIKKKNDNMDDARFKAALLAEGMTLEKLRQDLERQDLIMKVQQQEIGPRINITQEELRQFYNANRSIFMSPATVTLREIFFAVPTEGPAGRETYQPAGEAVARAKVEAVMTRLRAGEDFAALAKEQSDGTTKATGGLLGTIVLEELNPALKAMIEKAKVGEILPLVTGTRGLQILKVDARAESAPEPFEKSRTRIEQGIREERIGEETVKLLDRLRTQALVEWKDENLKQIYNSRVSALKTE